MHRKSLITTLTLPAAGLALLACLTIPQAQTRDKRKATPTPTPSAEKKSPVVDRKVADKRGEEKKKEEAKKEEDKPFKLEEAIARREKHRIVFKAGFEVAKSSNSTATVRRVTKNTLGETADVSCGCSDDSGGCGLEIKHEPRVAIMQCSGPSCCSLRVEIKK
ncbi:MAG TPA: hypothetical protein VFD58_19575 [Blastocatellia bacterium]|nr:hypothetical protein [Blastocatellia bacterium]